MTCILLTDADRFPLPAEARNHLRAAGGRLVELDGHEPEAIATAADRDRPDAILVYHAKFDATLIGRLAGVRVLGRCGTGYDAIDVDAARAAGIEVTYVPAYGVTDVADHALALMLACCRGVVAGAVAVREGDWPPYDRLGPFHRLAGRTLGLLGFGRIARALATRGAALGMEIAAHDPGLTDADVRAAGAMPIGFEAVLRDADVLSIHVPLTPRTRGLLDADAFAAMPPGAVLINTSRGEVVDEQALLAALDAGRLAWAGLDVFAHEPLAPSHPLRRHPRAVLTPHTAAFTDEALSEVAERAIQDVLRVLAGQPAMHPAPVAA